MMAMLARRAAIAVPAAVMVVGLTNPLAEAHADSVKACTALAEDGQRLRAAGKLIDAREKLMACSATECPQVVRTDCAQWASEVLAATPTIVIDAKDADGNDVADAKVSVDGRPVAARIDGRPIAIDPGSHRIYVERTDGSAATQTIVAKENAKAREVKMVLAAPGATSWNEAQPKADTSSGGWSWQHYAGIGLIVVGGALLTYSLATYITYKTDESSLRSKFEDAERAATGCASSSPPESTCGKNIATREDLRRQYNENEADIQDRKGVMMAAGVGGPLLIAGGVVLFIVAPKSTKSAPVQGGPIVTPTFGGMTLGGTF